MSLPRHCSFYLADVPSFSFLIICSAAAKSLQSCPTLCNPIDDRPSGSSVPGILQGHWSGVPFPSPMHACMLSCFSCVWVCATLWTAAHQAPLSTGFSRQEYWSGLPFLSPGSFALGEVNWQVLSSLLEKPTCWGAEVSCPQPVQIQESFGNSPVSGPPWIRTLSWGFSAGWHLDSHFMRVLEPETPNLVPPHPISWPSETVR